MNTVVAEYVFAAYLLRVVRPLVTQDALLVVT